MKKIFSISMLAMFAGLILTACGGDGSTTADSETKSTHKSEYFSDAVFSDGGDFVGMNLGDSRATVKSTLPEDAFVDETDGYLYYEWRLGNNDYYLDLYFDENDKLSSIDGYLYFYDADDYYDEAEAKKFYEDMKEFFSGKYGASEEENDAEYSYAFWSKDNMEAEVGLDEGEVYWYVYSYEDYGM